MEYICDICKRSFKTRPSWNKHAKKFKMNYKVFYNGMHRWMDLKSYLNLIMEVK